MSAHSTSNSQQLDSQSAALARDAYFSGTFEPADEVPTAEQAPPVRSVTDRPEREVTRQQIIHQTLRLEMLLSLWRLESGGVEGFWDAHPECAAATSSEPSVPCPAPVIDEDYLSQIALELFGNQAA